MKTKMVKKAILMATVAAMTVNSACPVQAAPEDHDTFKIGVLEPFLGDESTIRVNYYNNYIGPKYNCEFVFSEACTDLDTCISFIENCADSGCDAIINYAIGQSTEQLILVCQELGMTLVENGGMDPTNEAAYSAGYENFAGGFIADQPDTGRLFKDFLTENIDSSEQHGFIVATGGAYGGNLQQIEISTNVMEAIQDVYGLTFDSPIEELISASSPIEATNDKGYDVYCYPGVQNQSGWLEGLSAALQTGKYDYLLSSPNILGNVGTIVTEAEAAMNKDITVAGFGSFGEALTTAMNTQDQFGNQLVSMSTIKFTSIVSAIAFAKLYNNLTGYQNINEEDGVNTVPLFRMNAVTSPEQLAEMADWDTTDKWVADYDFVDSLLGEASPELTAEQFQENIYALDYDAIRARLG